jgi:hypothetical protein
MVGFVDTSGGSQDFILTQFNQTIYMDLSGIFQDGTDILIGQYNAICSVDISLSDWAQCFKITSDSVDIDDVNATDITYYVYNAANVAGLKTSQSIASLAGGSTLYNGNPSTSLVTNTPIDATVSNSVNKLQYDFIRHIAVELFNTSNGVDLFSNETLLRRSVEQTCDYGSSNKLINKIEQTLIDCAALGGITDIDSSYNLTYILLKQLFQKQPGRFINLDASFNIELSPTTPAPLPWVQDDTIWYVLTLHPAENQHLLVGKSTPINSRKYLIKMVLKD